MTIMDLREILEEAVRAPSGDNCQPWRFEVTGDTVRIIDLPGRDTSLFNHRQRASLVAHGALLENLAIVASTRGYTIDVTLFPDVSEPELVATVLFRPGAIQANPLHDAVKVRCTNRRRYDGSPLTDVERRAIASACEGYDGRLILTGNDDEKAFLAGIAALNDRLVFENENLHSFLFDHIRWSDDEARQTRDGLDIKTLDLAPPDALAFPLLKRWPLVRFLNSFGISRIVAGNARKLALSSSALGLILIPGAGAADYVNAGRILERIWLEAARIGLSVQLTTGITFLMQKVLEGDTSGLTAPHIELISEARRKIAARFGVTSETIAIMFRIGKSLPPSARSLRIPVAELITIEQ